MNQFLPTLLAHSTSAVLGYLRGLQHNPLIDWAIREITIQTKISIGSLDASRATKPAAHSQLSDPASLSPPVGSSVTPILVTLGASLELQAATSKVSIPFIKASALGLLRCFPPSRPQSTLCSGWVRPPSCSVTRHPDT